MSGGHSSANTKNVGRWGDISSFVNKLFGKSVPGERHEGTSGGHAAANVLQPIVYNIFLNFPSPSESYKISVDFPCKVRVSELRDGSAGCSYVVEDNVSSESSKGAFAVPFQVLAKRGRSSNPSQLGQAS